METLGAATIGTTGDARKMNDLLLAFNAGNIRHTYVTPSEDKKTWRVQQMLVDPEENNDWVVEFEVDLAESRKLGEPVLNLRKMGSLT